MATSRRVPFRDIQRTAEFAWLTAHSAEYRGQWVALMGTALVAAAPSLKELRRCLRISVLQNQVLVHRC